MADTVSRKGRALRQALLLVALTLALVTFQLFVAPWDAAERLPTSAGSAPPPGVGCPEEMPGIADSIVLLLHHIEAMGELRSDPGAGAEQRRTNLRAYLREHGPTITCLGRRLAQPDGGVSPASDAALTNLYVRVLASYARYADVGWDPEVRALFD